MITAVQCSFKRDKESDWERGLAITSARGLFDVLAIFPHDGASRVDVVETVWDYHLYWTDGILELEPDNSAQGGEAISVKEVLELSARRPAPSRDAVSRARLARIADGTASLRDLMADSETMPGLVDRVLRGLADCMNLAEIAEFSATAVRRADELSQKPRP